MRPDRLQEWQVAPPEQIVLGEGPLALALTGTFHAARLSFSQLMEGPSPNPSGGYPRVFEELQRVFIVMGNDTSAAEVIQYHRVFWGWVEKIASAGNQHELCIIFVLSGRKTSLGLEEALALGLGLSSIDPHTTGHGCWHQGGALCELLEVIAKTKPLDVIPLNAMQTADARHRALRRLCEAVDNDEISKVVQSARELLKVFAGKAFHLDLFCRPPSHRHGNMFRDWLRFAVEDRPTQEWLTCGREHLPSWIVKQELTR